MHDQARPSAPHGIRWRPGAGTGCPRGLPPHIAAALRRRLRLLLKQVTGR